ncbi:MAG: J domain-containing protein [Desulfobulbus sp.]|nr:MAG: J domain-containing protein [Desulfobulbus sp.]
MEYKDYYTILGVSRQATQEEIKRSYRKLARKYHPDVCKEADAESKFHELGEAYEVLQDPEKRAAYDKFGSNWKNGQDFEPPPDWNGGFEFNGAGYTGQSQQGGYSDFFENLFGRSKYNSRTGQSTFQMKGEDQHAKIVINLRDACKGSKQTLTLTKPSIDDHGQVTTKPQTLHVTIPRGIIQGQKIRLEGQGMPGMGGAPAGDLFLEIAFAEDPLFHAEKRDVFLTLPVTPWEAALGATVTVPTLDGNIQLTIPAGSQGGRKLRLKGKGLCTASSKGDMYVILRIVLPVPETAEQKELYKKMASLMPVNPRAEMGV